MSEPNLERVGEAFFEAEKAEGLVQWRIGNVSFWPVVRSRLLKAMTKNSRMFEAEGETAYVPEHLKTYQGRSPAVLMFKKLRRLPIRARLDEPSFKSLSKVTVLVVPPEERGLDGQDDASKGVIAEFGSRAFVLGTGIWDEVSPRPHVEELNSIFWTRYGLAGRVLARLLVSKADKARYAAMVNSVEQLAPLNPYNRFPYWMVSKHLVETLAYRAIFRRMRKLETVYYSGDEQPSILAVAKSRGLKLVNLLETESISGYEDTAVVEMQSAFLQKVAELALEGWKSRGMEYWPMLRRRILEVLTFNFRLAPAERIRLQLPDHMQAYTGRPPVRLLWAAVNRIPLKLRKGEPNFSNLSQLGSIIVPFATRDSQGIDKFAQPVIELIGSTSLVLGIGQWDQISPRARVEDLERFFRNRFRLWSKLVARLIVTVDTKAKYRRAAALLEKSGAKLESFETFPYELLEAFLAERRGYRRLFKRMRNLKHVYMVNAARMSFIAAAHERGIKVTEIQSGVFSKYSLQFSWPGSPRVDYIPDEILTWGEYWTEGIERASQQTVRVIGSTEEFEAARNKGIRRIEGQVVFLSQPLVGINLLNVAIDFAKARPDLKVIYKLHPRNLINDFKDHIGELGGASSNFKLVQNERSSLEVIAESEIAVGVFSTALIEAAGLDTKVAIIKLPGWQHLSPLVEGGHAGAFDTVEELLENVDKLPKSREGEFFYGKRADWHEVLGVTPAS